MTDLPFTRADLDRLAAWDTATLCNALEELHPERRHIGFTVERVHVVHPDLPTVVGLARTAFIRTQEPSRDKVLSQHDFYDYVESTDWPAMVVIQDIDDRPAFGAFIGDIAAAVYKGLGAVGLVTNGAGRDTRNIDPAFQVVCDRLVPSHANFHVIAVGCQVKVFGMLVAHGDVVAADYQGAVVIPKEAVVKLPAAAQQVVDKETAKLAFVRSPGFSAKTQREYEMRRLAALR